ncbi:beta-galactosidase GalB [uncultured Phocaeicola sp.]|uniref:beta-galactosidase GalB n=1 Tax=uncultured Phocaeicola sp. TaxID=990718 RepID=UPI0025E857F5|nr:beta-galactosidase GalB [uncultured Phocaeicola sp.]
MRKYIVNLLLLAFSIHLGAENVRVIENFDYNWLFGRYGLQADGSKIEEPAAVQDVSFNDSCWKQLDLPHDWAVEGPFRTDLEGFTGKLPWRGIGWYRKHFKVDKTDIGKRFYLDFDGAMAHAEVWLNGKKVGGHPYGYTSFRVDLTPQLSFEGENVVAVRLNTENIGSRWYPGAGIYRHVRLVKTSPVHVDHWGVFVTTPSISDVEAEALVHVQVRNHLSVPVKGHYSVSVYELYADNQTGRKVASSSHVRLDLPANATAQDSVSLRILSPKRWSLEATNRYLARVKVYDGKYLVDTYEVPFGFRTIQFTHDNGFLLNGKRVQIQGTCNHHDLGALGTAINMVALERQLKILKSFGCNALRTSHNIPAPELLELADKMGFLVMDEAFDCWREGKQSGDYGSLFDEWHEKDLKALVCRDRNHPSVILWSTGNEVSEQYHPELGIARHLTEVVHRYDKTRPVTFGASYPSKSAMNGTELQVDVHGMNYAAGVYGGPDFYGEFLNKEGHEHLSGFSSESSSTMSSRGEYFPRKFHVSSYDLNEPGWGGLPDQEFAALDRYPAICGEFVWTGFDYLGEPTPFNSDKTVLLNHAAAVSKEELKKQEEELKKIEQNRPTSRSSYFGIVDLAGFPKDRYYLYQSRWRPDYPMVHILPHWNWEDKNGKNVPVFVYSSGDEVELFLNGRSLGKKSKQPYEYRFRWDSVYYESGELKAIAYKDGKKWAEKHIRTTGKPERLKLTPDKKVLKSDGEDLIFVRVSVLDAEGNEVPTAEPLITSSVSGPGMIAATDNGDPTCLIPFHEPKRPAFNGLYLAIVKARRGSEGTLHLCVEADGLGKEEIDIRIQNEGLEKRYLLTD